jgi:predicted PurR-regulated permease PerM
MTDLNFRLQGQGWKIAAGLAVAGLLLWLLSPVLAPFFAAAILAYIGDPLVERMERRRVPRSLAVALVFTLLFGGALLAVLALVPVLERQAIALAAGLPGFLDRAQEHTLPRIAGWLSLPPDALSLEAVKKMLAGHLGTAGGVLKAAAAYVGESGAAVLLFVSNLLLVPLVTFYLLRDWNALLERVRGLLPRAWLADSQRLAGECDEVLGAFLRGQLFVMLSLATVYALGLSLVGVQGALLIGLLAGVVSFVPYLGFMVGLAAALLAAMVQFADWTPLLWVLLVFGIGQLLESFLLTPLLVGDRIGLHPVAVIFAVMAGGQLFGFSGVLLALPVAAVLLVLLKEALRRYQGSRFYQQ